MMDSGSTKTTLNIEDTLLTSFKAIDSLTPATRMVSQLQATSRIALDIVGSDSMLAATRSLEASSLKIAGTLDSLKLPPLPKLELTSIKLAQHTFTPLAEISNQLLANTSAMVQLAELAISAPDFPAVNSAITNSLNGLGSYMRQTSPAQLGLSTSRLGLASDSALGVTTSASLLKGIRPPKATLSTISKSVARTRPTLREALFSLNPALAEKLDGAHARIEDRGPDSFSQAANSFVEVIDWTLRLVAADEDILAWREGGDKRSGDLNDHGLPTRQLKVRYLLRERSIDSKLANVYVRNVVDIVAVVQGSKHTLGRKDYETLQGLEGIFIPTLAFILDCDPATTN